MNHAWRTKADVLKDLGAVNGRPTGAEHLDLHVVQGERPPPIHHEIPDEHEMNYFGGQGGLPADNVGPDLSGISLMLQMVNDMEESTDNEPMTLYHNRSTDEISISKLNPLAGEYVPGGNSLYQSKSGKSPTKGKKSVPKYVSPKKDFNNMFERPSDKKLKVCNVNENIDTSNMINSPGVKEKDEVRKEEVSQPKLLANGLPKRTIDKTGIPVEDSSLWNPSLPSNESKEHKQTVDKAVLSNDSPPLKHKLLDNGLPKRAFDKTGTPAQNLSQWKPSLSNNEHKQTVDKPVISNDSPPLKHKLLDNGLPKRITETSPHSKPAITKISPSKPKDKIAEIKEIQEKIKSTIIEASTDNSLQKKRQKNVAIATLLKLSTNPMPEEKPVKLLKPEYFKNPLPIEDDTEKKTEVNGIVERKLVQSSSSSSEEDLYIDPDSISKVNGWFSSNERPKPKPQLQGPLDLKEVDSITFKKKSNSSVTSRNSVTSKETKLPITEKKEVKSFQPSSYANDLLKKYESNAQRIHDREDLGSMLERQLKEKDEQIRQKMMAKQNAG